MEPIISGSATKASQVEAARKADLPLLVTIPYACYLTGMSRSKFYGMMRDGEIVPVKIGRSTRIRRTDLEAYVKALGGQT